VLLYNARPPISADNAGPHASAYTREAFQNRGIRPVFWSGNSPDLNSIETVGLMKDYMKGYTEEQDPKVHRSYMKLRKLVVEA
jgi:transposase